MTQTVMSGRRRASDDHAHEPRPALRHPATPASFASTRHAQHAPLPSRRALRSQPPAGPAPAAAIVLDAAPAATPAAHAATAATAVAGPTPAAAFVLDAAPAATPAAHAAPAGVHRAVDAVRPRLSAALPASLAVATPAETAPPAPSVPRTRREVRELERIEDEALQGAPSASSADSTDSVTCAPRSRSERRSAERRSTHRRSTPRPSPLARLRDNAATAGIVLASAGLVMGAVAPSAATDGVVGPTAAPEQAGVALASGVTPAVTAPAGATVTFGLESAGPAADEVAPSIASARALSASLTPAARERKAFSVPVDEPVVASTFGYRINPMGGYGSELHTGLDYASGCGTPVQAADAGKVVDSGWHAYGGGQRIVIDHGDGLKTTYNHMSVLDVPAGTAVKRGDVLGAVGSTGNSTGCHLHFEVLVNDEKVDPQPWL